MESGKLEWINKTSNSQMKRNIPQNSLSTRVLEPVSIRRGFLILAFVHLMAALGLV